VEPLYLPSITIAPVPNPPGRAGVIFIEAGLGRTGFAWPIFERGATRETGPRLGPSAHGAGYAPALPSGLKPSFPFHVRNGRLLCTKVTGP
jgi:hypothetical protein